MSGSAAPRVCWISETYFPPERGGLELVAAALTQGLASRGTPVIVLTRQTVPASAERETVDAVRVRRIHPPGVYKGQGWRALQPQLVYLLRMLWILVRERRQYDVIAVSGIKVIPLIVVPLCKLLGKRCALRVESTFELLEPLSAESAAAMGPLGPPLVAVADRVIALVLRHADRVIAISSQVRAELDRRGIPAARIATIPNGIDMREYRPIPAAERDPLRRALGLPQDRTLLLYTGRLSRAKGILTLLRIWPELLRGHRELCLVLVGTGKDSFDDCEAEAQQLVQQSGLADSVLFMGESPRVPQFLQAADLFVFPSEYEGFGVSIAEAMACALPIVSTAVGLAPEVIRGGQSGWLVPARDAASLRQALEEALHARADWPRIGQAAREAVRVYDLDHVLDAYASLCRELTGR